MTTLSAIAIAIHMKPTTNSDADWLDSAPDSTTPEDRRVATLEMNPGVYVREAPEGEPMQHATLVGVLAGTAPWGPESVITDAVGQVLAHVDQTRARWICTGLGRERVEREANGKPSVAQVKSRAKAIRELMEDSGYSRAEAAAWVDQFGVAS